MAARQITATQTLEDFRTQFNALSATDFGDIATLNAGLSATSVIGAVNELYAAIAGALSFTLSDGSNTQTLVNGNTLLFNGTANQITATVAATDKVTLALTEDVTIAGEFTASGTGTHTLGQLTFASSTITSSGSTITLNDDVTMPAAKTLTVDKISSNQSFVDFGSKNVSTDGFFYTTLASGGLIFEGSTADAHETKVTVVDPTADRTITFPNITGTVITTGDTGSITGTMIAADTVGEANMADDAIGQDQLKSVVTLQILNSSGVVVKTMFAAGA
mgnify:FL=1|nr:hypothetical protein [uncultured Mediterranean phage uvMED]|tara:strand:+ start:236 stop:1066 length:831 start_codon:yes stop_codon:yes gene_type:complete